MIEDEEMLLDRSLDDLVSLKWPKGAIDNKNDKKMKKSI